MAQTRSSTQTALATDYEPSSKKNFPKPSDEESAQTVTEEDADDEANGDGQVDVEGEQQDGGEELADGGEHYFSNAESNGKPNNNLVVHDMADSGVEETDATAQGSLSLDDAYNILADVGYSGKQNLHGPDAHISPLPGQVYLFYFPIERHPYKRFKINDGWYWHNKSKILYPREGPRIAKVVYRATGWRSSEKIRPENVLHTRKVYWLTAAEENNENAVILVEYIRDGRRSSSQQASQTSSSSANNNKMQTKRKILVDPPSRGTPLSGPSNVPRTKMAQNEMQRSFGSSQKNNSQFFRDGKKLRSSDDPAAEQQYSYGGATRHQMLQRVDEALQCVDQFKELLWSMEVSLRSVRADIMDMEAADEREIMTRPNF